MLYDSSVILGLSLSLSLSLPDAWRTELIAGGLCI